MGEQCQAIEKLGLGITFYELKQLIEIKAFKSVKYMAFEIEV